MRLKDIIEAKKQEPIKARDPNWRDMEALRKSGAAGSHGDKTKTIPRKEKYKKISMEDQFQQYMEADPDTLGKMNPKMRDMLSKVDQDDQVQAKADAEAKAKAKADQRAEAARLRKEDPKMLQQYVDMLKSHDWTYEYSDDHRVWTKGHQERGAIRSMAQKIDPDLEIYNKYDSLKQEGLDEKLNKGFFHTSVEKGKFMKSKYGDENTMYLHDLDNDADGRPMLVTFDDQADAEEAQNQYGGKIIKSGMGTFRIIKKEELDEKLGKDDDMGDWIKDFYKSDAPQFKGKSKEKRRQMAIAAKLGSESSDIFKALSQVDETATAGSTSAGNIATVTSPHIAIGDKKTRKKYGLTGGLPNPPKAKRIDPKDNALDMKGTSIFGGPLKR